MLSIIASTVRAFEIIKVKAPETEELLHNVIHFLTCLHKKEALEWVMDQAKLLGRAIAQAVSR
jgi:hypothetical protein